MTAVQEDLPIGVLVLNNGALGWVLHGMGEDAAPANWSQFAYADIARKIGCDSLRITSADELHAAVKSMSDLSRPLILDVPTSLDVSFQDVTSAL